jgi:hypothetical protein
MGEHSWVAWLACSALVLAPAGASGEEPSVKPPDMPPVQRPADPAAVGQQMTDMKAAADALIAEAKAELAKGKTPATELFVRFEGRIHQVMWPAFGPANAWLFNERGGKIRQLAEALGVAGEGRVGFEDYATVILAVLSSDADLQPFVDGEAGLDVSEQERTDGGGVQRGWSGPLRAEGLRTDERLGRIRGQLRAAVRDQVLPQLDAEHNRIRVRHAGRTTELVFQWIDRWVLAEIASHP